MPKLYSARQITPIYVILANAVHFLIHSIIFVKSGIEIAKNWHENTQIK